MLQEIHDDASTATVGRNQSRGEGGRFTRIGGKSGREFFVLEFLGGIEGFLIDHKRYFGLFAKTKRKPSRSHLSIFSAVIFRISHRRFVSN